MSRETVPGKGPVVTLDGLSGSGKSTLARELARALGWAYLDSGAWYRALTWAVLREDADPASADAVLAVLSRLDLHADADGRVHVDGQPLGTELRSPAIDAAVSEVADHPPVRAALTERMRALREQPKVSGVVADGRDAGAVIFPDAGLKVFVQVSPAERAHRRYQQQRRLDASVDRDQVEANLRRRDARDAQRGEAAPRVHPGDRVLDNETLSVEEAIRRLLSWTHAVHGSDQQASRPD